jgi:hypothetical protein
MNLSSEAIVELDRRLADYQNAQNVHALDDTDQTWCRERDRLDEYVAALTRWNACNRYPIGCRQANPCPVHSRLEQVRASHPVAD